jgi:hypothetical protein
VKVKIKNIAKQITSLLLLWIGLSFLTSGVEVALVTHYISSNSSVKLSIPAIIYRVDLLRDIFIGILIITVASYFWSWGKNLKIFGIFFCVVGFTFTLKAFSTLANPPLKDYAPFSEIFPTSIVVGFLSSAILFIIIGLLIIYEQKNFCRQ